MNFEDAGIGLIVILEPANWSVVYRFDSSSMEVFLRFGQYFNDINSLKKGFTGSNFCILMDDARLRNELNTLFIYNPYLAPTEAVAGT